MTKKKTTSYPLNLGIFGTDAVALYAQKAANLIQEALPAHGHFLVPLVNSFRFPIRELTGCFQRNRFLNVVITNGHLGGLLIVSLLEDREVLSDE